MSIPFNTRRPDESIFHRSVPRQIVEEIAAHTGHHLIEVEDILAAYHRAILYRVLLGRPVVLRGFGTFSSRLYHARQVFCPADGTTREVPNRRILHFKMSPTLRPYMSTSPAAYNDPETPGTTPPKSSEDPEKP